MRRPRSGYFIARVERWGYGLCSAVSIRFGKQGMAGLTIGNLELDSLTTTVLLIATVFFLGSFVFVSRTNDMIGALKSLLPKKKNRTPLPGPDEPL
tara:strand:- start:76 stop:363 length:288 start_codon:yes stop_codon:yes gene_type:complete